MTYGYQWQQCDSSGGTCSAISGATSSSYALPSTLAGKTLRVTVTATNSVGSSSTQSAATATVASSAPSSPSSPTFDSVTAYLDTPLPSLSSAITVWSASAFSTAVANATAGQTINVLGNVLIPGEFTGFDRVISGGTVNVVFQPGAGFTGNAGARLPAVWIKNSGGWRIWGGTITNPMGNGIVVYNTVGNFTWTGFKVSNTGDTCVALYPSGGNINGITLKGVAGTATPNLAYDPHAEKGTGIHAWNIADATGGLVQNATLAMDTVDQATGAAVEVEAGQLGPNVKMYARARHLGFAIPGTTWLGYAQQQGAGNVFQVWGATPQAPFDLAYAEGNNIMGRILETDGAYGGADYSQSTLDYGRATGPILQSPLITKVAYARKANLTLGNVSPLP
jgi:hypothetical protein